VSPLSLPGRLSFTRPKGLRLADGLLGGALLALVIVAGNLDRMPQGLEEFLAIRLSLKNILLLAAFSFAWAGLLTRVGLYDATRRATWRHDWPRVAVAAAIGAILALVFPLLSRSGAAREEHPLIFALLVVPTTVLLHAGVRAARRFGRRGRSHQVLLVGSGPLAARALHDLQHGDRHRAGVIGFVDSLPQPALSRAGSTHLGPVGDLERILMHTVVDEVLIALPIKSRYEEIQHSLSACHRVGIPATYPADLFRTQPGLRYSGGEAVPPVLSLLVAPDDYRLSIKRAMDVLGGAALLVLCAPVMLVVALAVKLTSEGPVLFAQERYGHMKRRFRMLKFRTMTVGAEQLQLALESRNEAAGPVFKIRDDPRFTSVGAFLRRTSLDELPQLWHVITGEMSLVGPRPLPVRDVGRFNDPRLMRRFSMRPGLTCLWQISGRSRLGFDQWIALDLQYIDTWSLRLDLAILLKTVPAVLRGDGAM
jgi:exopolysaccharide biosynthesis polyprenyl glycosylphosphotransferase